MRLLIARFIFIVTIILIIPVAILFDVIITKERFELLWESLNDL